MDAPSGTVTFLFTDIEESTRAWEVDPAAMAAALARHDAILRQGIAEHGGYVFSTAGDGLAAAFSRARDAVSAAKAIQERLGSELWPAEAPIRVRMGLHTGEAEEREGDYLGPAVNRAARIMALGHGGQVLLSATTAALVPGGSLLDLGEHGLSGIGEPQRVFQLGSAKFAALRGADAIPTNLPADRSLFVGRDQEIATVISLIRSVRIVTLTGVGGVGKTRLALRVASELCAEFPDGVWVVELAPLIEASLVASTVASVLGTPPSPGVEPTDVICRFLARRRALVVLDNGEHVIDAAAGLVDRLLAAAPRTRILTTSREPLGITGEAVWRVPSLGVGAEDCPGDALALFADRAAGVRAGFGLDERSTPAVMAICRRLDGIPLAIELAAARAGSLSVEQISAHLDERFRLLTRGGRTAVARQQTLQGAIDWSYELLGPTEQGLFDRLGVFAGDFDLAAVAAVAQVDDFDALELVGRLVDKSMVEADPGRDRFLLLETLRQYAWDRLVATGELGAARDRHATWYLSLAGEQASLMASPGQQVKALDRLEEDFANFRAALSHLIESRQADSALRLARRLIGLFNIRHPAEGYGWFKAIVAVSESMPPRTRARLLAETAFAAFNAGDGQAQLSYALDAIELGGSDVPAIAHHIVATSAINEGEYERARDHAQIALDRAVATNEISTRVIAAATLVHALGFLGDEMQVRPLISEALTLAKELGNPTLTTAAHLLSAEALIELGAVSDAAEMLESAMKHVGDAGPVIACSTGCWYVMVSDDHARAVVVARQFLGVATNQLSGYHQVMQLMSAAKVLVGAGKLAQAALLLGAFRSLTAAWGSTHVLRWYEPLRESLNDALGDETLKRAISAGEALSLTEALAFAGSALSAI